MNVQCTVFFFKSKVSDYEDIKLVSGCIIITVSIGSEILR